MNTLPNLHKYLVQQKGMGTFLRFTIYMGGCARAEYTHGSIEFESMDDLTSWAEGVAANPEYSNELARQANRARNQ